MKFLRNVVSQLHTFILWLLASFLLWTWIFSFVGDTSPAKKLTLYCNVPAMEDTALAVKLEEDKPDNIRMIKVHPFSYVMFDMENIEKGDVFILPESEKTDLVKKLLPGLNGEPIKVYDADTKKGILTDYITYGNEDYYLYLGSKSVHLEDGLAVQLAQKLLNMP